jgi:serine/threonine protein phosphatase PrpC
VGAVTTVIPVPTMPMEVPRRSSSANCMDEDQREEDGQVGVISVLFAGKTRKGNTPSNPRKPNQDAFFMKHDPNTSSLVIACFDGHGKYGHEVSRFCKQYMERNLCLHPAFSYDVRHAVIETTASLENDMLAAPHIDTIFSGTTMILLIIRGTMLYVANVGDSRVVLGNSVANCKGGKEAKKSPTSNFSESTNSPDYTTKSDSSPFTVADVLSLSKDHKPDTPAERRRIEEAGGRVKMVHQTARVYLATDDIPGLAMSRSLGDFVAHRVGVSSVPEFFEYDLSEVSSGTRSGGLGGLGGLSGSGGSGSGRQAGRETVRSVLLIGTDGVYDMISNDAAVGMAFAHWGDPAGATDAIVSYTGKQWANRWGLADDTTLCVVNLEHVTGRQYGYGQYGSMSMSMSPTANNSPLDHSPL